MKLWYEHFDTSKRQKKNVHSMQKNSANFGINMHIITLSIVWPYDFSSSVHISALKMADITFHKY